VRAVVDTAFAGPALLTFAEATLLARGRPDLAPRVRETFERLHVEAERAITENLAARGWEIRTEPAAEARGFWAALLGVALQGVAQGDGVDEASARAAAVLVLNLYTDPDRVAPDGPR
jgi:hypothetical protein